MVRCISKSEAAMYQRFIACCTSVRWLFVRISSDETRAARSCCIAWTSTPADATSALRELQYSQFAMEAMMTAALKVVHEIQPLVDGKTAGWVSLRASCSRQIHNNPVKGPAQKQVVLHSARLILTGDPQRCFKTAQQS